MALLVILLSYHITTSLFHRNSTLVIVKCRHAALQAGSRMWCIFSATFAAILYWYTFNCHNFCFLCTNRC